MQRNDLVTDLCGGGGSLRSGGEYGLGFIVGVHGRRGAPAVTKPVGGASICALGQAKALSYGLTSVQSKLNMDTPAAGNVHEVHDWRAKQRV